MIDPDSAAKAASYDGTHSLLDIVEGVSPTPAYGTVWPLTEEQLKAFFHTTHPTDEQISAAQRD